MFPLAQVPVAVAQFLAVYWGLIALAGGPTMRVTWRAVIGRSHAAIAA